mmetsp:Transcript_94933/g.257656  ORF Transcript_94933/g.257656 Transcript_94933/m.257656 type:complete len:219 (+) Transcript_94933:255-911(+)
MRLPVSSTRAASWSILSSRESTVRSTLWPLRSFGAAMACCATGTAQASEWTPRASSSVNRIMRIWKIPAGDHMPSAHRTSQCGKRLLSPRWMSKRICSGGMASPTAQRSLWQIRSGSSVSTTRLWSCSSLSKDASSSRSFSSFSSNFARLLGRDRWGHLREKCLLFSQRHSSASAFQAVAMACASGRLGRTALLLELVPIRRRRPARRGPRRLCATST